MADVLIVYISAAGDLELEREVLSRAITEIPTTLAWHIVLTPLTAVEPDYQAIQDADMHVLLLGSDVRAPVGVEWVMARRAHHLPTLLLKSAVNRTQAAQAFVRELERYSTWHSYTDPADLRRQVLRQLVDHILTRRDHFQIGDDEFDKISDFRKGLTKARKQKVDPTLGGAGNSSVILSTERYVPSKGVLLKAPDKLEEPKESN